MSAPDGTVTIRSFRVCFELERRLHKIDRWRIPLPYGVPLRGLGYALVALLTVLVLSSLPLTGALLKQLPATARYAVLPIGIAYAMIQWKLDGRPAHTVGLAWLRFMLGPRRLCAFRAAPAPGPALLQSFSIAHDDSGARVRKGVVRGPARVTLRYPSDFTTKGKALYVERRPGAPLRQGQRVTLRPNQRLVIK